MKETVRWLLKGPEAVTIQDKFLLFIVKITYLGLRASIRITLWMKKSDKPFAKQVLDFGSLWFRSYRIFKKRDDGAVLKFKMPKYNIEFYCKNNKDDFTTMTMREDEIIHHFNTKQGDIVVDVGAHIGKYTLIASKRVGANGKVIAIEAHPGNYEMLNRNIKLNGLTNVTTLNYAAYSKESKIKLYVPDEKFNHTIYNTLISSKTKDEEKFVEVNAN